MVHGRCIDSAVLFPNPRGLPNRPSLRKLAADLLGRTIQEAAHDSFVDAEVALQARLAPPAAVPLYNVPCHVSRTAILLLLTLLLVTLQAVQLKLRNGPNFKTAKLNCTHLPAKLASYDVRQALVGPRELLMLHAALEAQVVAASSDSQAIAAALQVLGVQPDAAAGAAGARGNSSDTQAATGVQQRRPPPELLWVHLGDLWGCLQERAGHIARQVGLLLRWGVQHPAVHS